MTMACVGRYTNHVACLASERLIDCCSLPTLDQAFASHEPKQLNAVMMVPFSNGSGVKLHVRDTGARVLRDEPSQLRVRSEVVLGVVVYVEIVEGDLGDRAPAIFFDDHEPRVQARTVWL